MKPTLLALLLALALAIAAGRSRPRASAFHHPGLAAAWPMDAAVDATGPTLDGARAMLDGVEPRLTGTAPTRGETFIAELAEAPELSAWLERNGIAIEDAVRLHAAGAPLGPVPAASNVPAADPDLDHGLAPSGTIESTFVAKPPVRPS